ncbi:MAG: competence protein ComFB [Cellulosilyticum sp.]|nr:competence protein ComFB [Cellulosilyticum sp.]
MIIYNIMEEFVSKEVNHLIAGKNYKGCLCERCKADIMALALNQLPAKYVVTEQGQAICKVVATMPQNKVDILAAVVEASKMVMVSPRH